jgi:sugar phosphate isomerase/epimerase
MTAGMLLESAAELGVHVVQIADNMRLDAMDLDRLVEDACRLGISLEAGTCGIAFDHLLSYLGIARRIGSPILRVVIDSDGHEPSLREIVETMRSVLPEFEGAGVKLAIENHDRFPAATLRNIVERTGAFICLDTANSLGCLEGLDSVLEALGPWVVNVHIKDVAAVRLPHQKGFVIEGRPAGQGALKIPHLLSRLREFGNDPSVILEQWPPPEPDIEASVAKERQWATEGIRYLRTLIPD